jgi:hypothetical protein
MTVDETVQRGSSGDYGVNFAQEEEVHLLVEAQELHLRG